MRYVACMRNEMCIILLTKQKWKDHLEDPGIEGWNTFKLIFKKQYGRHRLV